MRAPAGQETRYRPRRRGACARVRGRRHEPRRRGDGRPPIERALGRSLRDALLPLSGVPTLAAPRDLRPHAGAPRSAGVLVPSLLLPETSAAPPLAAAGVWRVDRPARGPALPPRGPLSPSLPARRGRAPMRRHACGPDPIARVALRGRGAAAGSARAPPEPLAGAGRRAYESCSGRPLAGARAFRRDRALRPHAALPA